MAASLVCPGCGASPAGDERFCSHCGMPLAAPGVATLTERQQRARKIDPRYSDGPLVWAAWARNEVEAELIAGLLIEEGVPSLIRRAPGFDVPDFMASGPREILVPASGLEVAREILGDTGAHTDTARASDAPPLRRRLLAFALLAITLVTVVIFMASHVWD